MTVAVNGISVEEELALRLSKVACARAREHERIRDLCALASVDELHSVLHRQRLLALLGSRVVEICGESVPPSLRGAVEDAIAQARHRHTLNAHVTRDFCRRLEGAGIEAVPLKGPLLAERIFSDPALRASPHDLDILICAPRFRDAVELFCDLGYTVHDDTIWAYGLPHYHYGLSPGRPDLPKLELHWRIHWYEQDFAPRLIGRATLGPDGVRCPTPPDELASLLIIFARDGFVGLRLAADIGAWWDAHGAALPRPGLDEIIEENPPLRSTLLAALQAAQDLIGLPKDELVSDRWRPNRRARMAPLLANWRQTGERLEIAVNITLIDLLLTPPGAGRVFVRHYYLQPMVKYAREYGWNPDARLRNQLRRAARAAVRALRSSVQYTGRLWAVRHGTRLQALPPPVPGARSVGAAAASDG